jgi:hypothetical protein
MPERGMEVAAGSRIMCRMFWDWNRFLVNDSIPIAIWDVSRFFCDLLVSLDG